MAFGPGKYDDYATLFRERTDAKLVLVCAIDGSRGNGFSIQGNSKMYLTVLSKTLREIADDIDKKASLFVS